MAGVDVRDMIASLVQFDQSIAVAAHLPTLSSGKSIKASIPYHAGANMSFLLASSASCFVALLAEQRSGARR